MLFQPSRKVEGPGRRNPFNKNEIPGGRASITEDRRVKTGECQCGGVWNTPYTGGDLTGGGWD